MILKLLLRLMEGLEAPDTAGAIHNHTVPDRDPAAQAFRGIYWHLEAKGFYFRAPAIATVTGKKTAK